METVLMTQVTQKNNRRRGRCWNRKPKYSPEEIQVSATTVTETLKEKEMRKGEAPEALFNDAPVFDEKPRRKRGGRRRYRKASQKTSESEGSVVEQNTEPSLPWNYRAHRAKNAERRKVYAEEDRIKMEHTIEKLKEMWRKKEERRRTSEAQEKSHKAKNLTPEEEMEQGFQRMEQHMENLMIQSDQEEYEQLTQANLTQTPLSSCSSGPQAPKSASGDSNSSAYCTEEIKTKLRQIYINLGLPPPSDLNEVIVKRPLQKPYLPPPPPPPGFMPFFSPIMPPIQFPTYFPYPPPFYTNSIY